MNLAATQLFNVPTTAFSLYDAAEADSLALVEEGVSWDVCDAVPNVCGAAETIGNHVMRFAGEARDLAPHTQIPIGGMDSVLTTERHVPTATDLWCVGAFAVMSCVGLVTSIIGLRRHFLRYSEQIQQKREDHPPKIDNASAIMAFEQARGKEVNLSAYDTGHYYSSLRPGDTIQFMVKRSTEVRAFEVVEKGFRSTLLRDLVTNEEVWVNGASFPGADGTTLALWVDLASVKTKIPMRQTLRDRVGMVEQEKRERFKQGVALDNLGSEPFKALHESDFKLGLALDEDMEETRAILSYKDVVFNPSQSHGGDQYFSFSVRAKSEEEAEQIFREIFERCKRRIFDEQQSLLAHLPQSILKDPLELRFDSDQGLCVIITPIVNAVLFKESKIASGIETPINKLRRSDGAYVMQIGLRVSYKTQALLEPLYLKVLRENLGLRAFSP